MDHITTQQNTLNVASEKKIEVLLVLGTITVHEPLTT